MAYTQEQINALIKEGPSAIAALDPAFRQRLQNAIQGLTPAMQQELLQNINAGSGGMPVDLNDGSASALTFNRGPGGQLTVSGVDQATGRPFSYDPSSGLFESNAGDRWHDVYDANGNWTNRNLSSSGWVDFREGVVKPVLTAAGMYLGSQYLMGDPGVGATTSGTAGGVAGGAGATGGLTAAELEALTAIQQGGAFGIDGITGMTSFGDGLGAVGAAGGAAGGAVGGGTDWANWAANEVAGASSNPATAAQLNAMAGGSGTPFMNSGGGGLFDGLGANSSTLGKLAGAALGAASAKDQQQTTTSSRDPWGPAQPFLKGLLQQGQTLNAQYQANPFSDAQKTSYTNLGGLLNTLNSQAGGLMGGFGANASGANNYDRSNPRKQLTGSSFNLSGFNPGLLNFFPRG